MLFRIAELREIEAGNVDLAFRRWASPRVKVGSKLRTQIGLVEVTSVEAVQLDSIDEEAARRAGIPLPKLLKFMERFPERAIYRVGLQFAGDDPRVALREDDDLSDDDVATLIARLDRFDRAATRGPWTRETLELIQAQPATLAADLAAGLGLETLVFKRDVRKLKELGLTESLKVGYRLSPRGTELLRKLHA